MITIVTTVVSATVQLGIDPFREYRVMSTTFSRPFIELTTLMVVIAACVITLVPGVGDATKDLILGIKTPAGATADIDSDDQQVSKEQNLQLAMAPDHATGLTITDKLPGRTQLVKNDGFSDGLVGDQPIRQTADAEVLEKGQDADPGESELALSSTDDLDFLVLESAVDEPATVAGPQDLVEQDMPKDAGLLESEISMSVPARAPFLGSRDFVPSTITPLPDVEDSGIRSAARFVFSEFPRMDEQGELIRNPTFDGSTMSKHSLPNEQPQTYGTMAVVFDGRSEGSSPFRSDLGFTELPASEKSKNDSRTASMSTDLSGSNAKNGSRQSNVARRPMSASSMGKGNDFR